MRFYPLFLGTFFFSCLLVTVPTYYDYVVTKQIFAGECGRPIEDYTCFQDELDPNGSCKAADPEFDRAERSLVRVFIASPEIVQQATCSLDQINVIRYLTDLPGKIQLRGNQLDISWSMLKERNFLFADRLLWSQAGYVFKDAFVKYNERRDLFLSYTQPEEQEGQLGLDVATVLFHEMALKIEQDFLSGDHARCEPVRTTHNSDCISPVRQSHGASAWNMDTDPFNAFTKPYDICDSSKQFAQSFSAYLMREHLGLAYKVYLDDNLLLDQELLLNAKQFQPKLKTVKALLSYDVSTPEGRAKLMADHKTCAGAFGAD
ncbi:hypothetical protein [uncultured Maritalea sp.]|jgi:hypothetical protein|uniref:hypothetical protein n=1 Tax=uncultured Maritalea sp. TaxID=757249 RepID=UPI0026163B8F|nr:hypothetical protein [uncultured Maritalea sp.]